MNHCTKCGINQITIELAIKYHSIGINIHISNKGLQKYVKKAKGFLKLPMKTQMIFASQTTDETKIGRLVTYALKNLCMHL